MKVKFSNRSLINPLLRLPEIVLKFFTFDPSCKDSVKSCYEKILSTTYDRSSLSELLGNYNKRIGNDTLSLNNCNCLKLPDTTVVVTGQQAGMFTGPLYTIYKIVSAINLAKSYSQTFKTPVVPVFWNATEDHDLSEINTFDYPEKKWKAQFPTSGIAAECLKTSPGVEDLVRKFISTISEVNHKKEIEELLRIDHRNYGEYSSSIIAKLFRGTGLVVLEPRILREKSRDVFRKCIEDFQSIGDSLKVAGTELAKINLRPSFEIAADTTGLFYINSSGHRNRILERNGKFLVDKKFIPKTDILDLIDHYPERLSTSAFIRPIFQSLNLPNIAYIAGPGEYHYHLQLQPIYNVFNATMPLIYLRNHCTVLTQKEQKLAHRLHLEIDDFFKGPEFFYNSIKLPEKVDIKFIQIKKKLNDLTTELYQGISELVTEQHLTTFKTNLFYHLGKLKTKTEKNYSRQCKVDNARIDRFFHCILPKNLSQERIINIVYFIEYEGPDFIKDLINVLDPIESRHYILLTEN